jgi:hypothetical protein
MIEVKSQGWGFRNVAAYTKARVFTFAGRQMRESAIGKSLNAGATSTNDAPTDWRKDP